MIPVPYNRDPSNPKSSVHEPLQEIGACTCERICKKKSTCIQNPYQPKLPHTVTRMRNRVDCFAGPGGTKRFEGPWHSVFVHPEVYHATKISPIMASAIRLSG